MAISKIDSDGITAGGITADSLNIGQIGGRRNLIINGAMQVAQRGTSLSGITTGGYKTVDRIEHTLNNLGTWTSEQSSDAPDGFANSLKLTCTSADASPVTNDYMVLFHKIEAQNLQMLQYGTSGAKTATISFWVKSNKTGSASFGLRQPDNSNRQFTPSYTISSANTWEYKTITIPADTSGVINNDNGSGFQVEWWLNSGPDFTTGTNQNNWAASNNPDRNPSNLGVGGANNDYFAITGVQLEVGSVATPFEHISYGESLALCQRYYYRMSHTTGLNRPFAVGYADSTSNAYGFTFFPVTMRDQPSAIEQSNTASHYEIRDAGTTRTCTGVPAHANASRYGAHYFFTASGLTAGRGVMLRASGNDGYLGWSAEL